MGHEELGLVWSIVMYVGALVGVLVLLRTLFVPPSGGNDRKSPFETWIEFSQKRSQENLRAELEKYRIDRGLAHSTRDPSA